MYQNIGVAVLLNAIGLAKDKQIGTAELNVFKCLLKIYKGYECGRLAGTNPQYVFPERSKLVSLTGYSKEKIGRALSKLHKSKLLIDKNKLSFNTTLLPVAYSTRRDLGQSDTSRLTPLPTFFFSPDNFTTKSSILSFLSLAIRCCWQERGVLNYTGRVTVKAIVAATGLARRTVQYALDGFSDLFEVTTEGEKFWVVNKYGRQISVQNEAEVLSEKAKEDSEEAPSTPGDPISAPPKPQIDPIFAPLIRQENSPTERSKYQRTSSGASLRDIKKQDLEEPKRLFELFLQAKARGLVTSTETSKLNFVALSVHALRVGRDAVRLFAANLQAKNFQTISSSDEEVARKVIQKGRRKRQKLTEKIVIETYEAASEAPKMEHDPTENREFIRAQILESLSFTAAETEPARH